jgi:competence protein ComEC
MFLLPVRQSISVNLPGARTDLSVTFLAVGAGQCAVVEPPSGRVALIDAGSASLGDALFKCIGPFLRHEGYESVDSVFITHANLDHFSAVAELVEGYGVREVLTAHQFRAHSKDNVPAEALLSALDRIERPPRTVAPGDRIPLGRDSAIEILWPDPNLPADMLSENDASLVFRLGHGEQSILITGDIQDDAMRQLLKSPGKLRADVLVAPHHGSSETLTKQFVTAVAPRYVICSNDRTLTRKQVRLDRIVKESGAELLRTHTCGAITVRLGAAGDVVVDTFLPVDRAPNPG